jgi:hypothetical protein
LFTSTQCLSDLFHIDGGLWLAYNEVDISVVRFAWGLWGADDLFIEGLENRNAFVSEGGIVFVT